MSYEVEMGRWGCHVPSGYPEDVVITGLGPCVGVIAYDAGSRTSFSTHLTSPDVFESTVLDEMLTEAAAHFASSALVHVYVTGACGEGSEPSKGTLAKRAYVTEKVTRAFPAATVKIEWPSNGMTSTSMTLVPETGEHYFGGPR
jgi:hypothetical protein